MNKSLLTVLLISFFATTGISQDKPITPENNPFNKNLIQNEISEMTWFVLKDTSKMEIGKVKTEITKQAENILIVTTVSLRNAQTKWVDSTIAELKTLKPVYHSSYNQQRDMIINFDKVINGYYLDKSTKAKTIISESPTGSYFDSNIYPQLIRWLPLTDNYSSVISIFDYNPAAKTGMITATLKRAEKISLSINGRQADAWKVTMTDDISDNAVISTYYIDSTTRKILKQEMDVRGRKMIMESIN